MQQALAWAKAEGITLPQDWRQELAKRMAYRLLEGGPAKLDSTTRDHGRSLMQSLTA